jgi:hypothetical protein
MAKKDLASVTTDLSALASAMPTQRPPAQPAREGSAAISDLLETASSGVFNSVAGAPESLTAATKPKEEKVAQFSLSLREGLRKQLARLADDADMTMRAFVLNALKAKGLDVRADDLADLRKERR